MLPASNGVVPWQTGLSSALMMMACVWSVGPCRVAVKGMSMAPALLPGDHLLVRPVHRGTTAFGFLSARLRRGDLVVLADPESPGRWVVKRVAAAPGESVDVAGRHLRAEAGVVVLGDNAAASTDSRDYGAVPLDAVHGRVWYRYAPADRAGRL